MHTILFYYLLWLIINYISCTASLAPTIKSASTPLLLLRLVLSRVFCINISFNILFVTSHDVTKKYRSQISKETSLILTPNPLGFLRYSASIFFGDVILRTTARNITSKYRDHHILTERVLNMQTKMCESIHLFGMKPPHLIILTSLPQNIYPFYNRHNYYFWATELLLCKCLQILFYLCSVVTNIY
jgi:ABC-type phosphate/phosphonate transport system permease subunit